MRCRNGIDVILLIQAGDRTVSKPMTNTATGNRYDDLIPLIMEAFEAFSQGDKVKASAFRAKINIRLRKLGETPEEFWEGFKLTMERLQAKDGFVPNDTWKAFHA